MSKEKVVARVTIYGIPDMSPEGRERLSDWLRDEARMLMSIGPLYNKRYISRFIAVPKRPKKGR